ncbi:DNA alkylation repair protein [Brevibacterium aurantiacum]|uniref:DNA alkylation repair protein n=1 Tax=Brevibacterium aurantiacum TaxID=273384 RepID=A0A556CQF3_BREAU|nr:DNA alkylation repair protein [Brevibacterium aurantiacum]TSI19657.1 DNA alkylation repair protein [Brevibacterium aurantiacum]
MTSAASGVRFLAEVLDRELRYRGSSERATKERAYLKSELVHYGVGVPATRGVVREVLRTSELKHDGVIALAEQLWDYARDADGMEQAASRTPVYELRSAATMVLIHKQDHLGADDIDLFERLPRQAHTWALVDPLAGDAIGPLSEHDAKFDPTLERWAGDEDLWIRRSALLAHLRPLREGRGDFARFSRFADAMLEEKEFFIRKAIGWVLRDTARTRPDMVFDRMRPRAHRASGVTMREAVKHLSPKQRDALLAVPVRGTRRIRAGSD